MSNKYDPSKLARHTPHGSKYSQRHPEQGRPLQLPEPVKPEKKRGPQENPAQDFRKTFMAAAREAEWTEIPGENRTAFLNVLNEAVMMKATLLAVQNPNGTPEKFANELCENLFRRVRDHAAGGAPAFTQMLKNNGAEPRKLEPELKSAVMCFATKYYAAKAKDLKAALSAQYSQGK